MSKTYKLTYDIHTHTIFSHGLGTIEDNVKAAVEKGLKTIGISDHGPGHVSYGIKRSDPPVMRQEIERLAPLYPQIEILLGVEANVVNPSGALDVSKAEAAQYDYILAGYHYGVFGEKPVRAAGLIAGNFLWEHTGVSLGRLKKANTEMTVASIYENDIKILTHPGDKGPFEIREIAKACQDRGTLMEINNFHKCLTVADIRIAAEYDVSFVISSDAHQPLHVGAFELGLKRAQEAELPLSRIVNLTVTDTAADTKEKG